MYKVFCIVACLAVASAQILRADEEYDPNPSYSFNYEVQDPLTGDSKSQSESRQGDSVQGSYSLIEADGSRRIVDYTADAINGFNAVVHKEGVDARVLAPRPVIKSAPIRIAARPIAYSSSPYAYAQGPVSVAHGPAVVHSAFNTPYATYNF